MPARSLTLKNGNFTSTVQVLDWDGEAGTIDRGVIDRAKARIGGSIESAILEDVGSVEFDLLDGSPRLRQLYRIGRSGW